MRVPPLPIGGLFSLGCVAPVVVFFVLRFQVLVPVRIFLGAPLMCLMVPVVILSGDDRGGCQQTDSQHDGGEISQHGSLLEFRIHRCDDSAAANAGTPEQHSTPTGQRSASQSRAKRKGH